MDYVAEATVLATGMNDVRPDPPLPRTGRGLHYCLHCDAHVFADESVYVIGHGESAAHVAAILLTTVVVRLRTRNRRWALQDVNRGRSLRSLPDSNPSR